VARFRPYALAVMFVFTASAHFNKMKHDLARMIPAYFPRPLLIVYRSEHHAERGGGIRQSKIWTTSFGRRLTGLPGRRLAHIMHIDVRNSRRGGRCQQGAKTARWGLRSTL
jgi:hypothetical protein